MAVTENTPTNTLRVPRPGERSLDDLMASLQPWSMVEEWTQPRSLAQCRRVTSGCLGGDAFIKLKPDADPGDGPSEHYTTLAQIWDASPTGRVAPRPLAWGSDPYYLAYEWASGATALEVLRRDGNSTEQRAAVTAACARLLARLHSIDPHAVDAYVRSGGSYAPAVATRHQVLSVIDLGSWNIVIGADGIASFIDIPILGVAEPEHDMARLASRLAGQESRRVGVIGSARAAHTVFSRAAAAYLDEIGRVDALRPARLAALSVRQVLVTLRQQVPGCGWGAAAPRAIGTAFGVLRASLGARRRALRRRARSAAPSVPSAPATRPRLP